MPISATAPRMSGKNPAVASSTSPASVKVMPRASENGFGHLSVYQPTSGCNSEAVAWFVKVMSPICAKLSVNVVLSSG
jgi:hypothetical protein